MLYALPDHEVMENLLPSVRERRLTVAEAVERLRAVPGLVPVAINPHESGSVYFADIGDAPLLEWKYIYTIERLAGEGSIGEVFATDLAVLERDDLITDSIPPHGLLFHVSRCGSTLLTKSLARSARNLCINQGGPLQEGFWAVVTDHWRHPPVTDPRTMGMLRNIVLLMSRRRRREYRRCFVKFISWNVIYLDFIRAAFPDVPVLYLYRDPVEVIATVLRETTAALRVRGGPLARALTGLNPAETAGMGDIEYLARCYAHYFDIVLTTGAAGDGFHVLNYKSLKNRESYADVLSRGFGFTPGPAELAQMREQYRYYSKDDSDRTIFSPGSEPRPDAISRADRERITALCGAALDRLDRSPQNLFPGY